MSTASPLATRSPVTRTSVLGGEKIVAFSTNSASMWMTSAAARLASAADVRQTTLTRV